MTSKDRKEYERACADAVREMVKQFLKAYSLDFRAVEARGEYPDTEIVVAYFDPRYDRVETWDFPLWKGEYETGERPGEMKTPEDVATMICYMQMEA